MTTRAFVLEQIAACEAEAVAATLPMVRERALRSKASWEREMARTDWIDKTRAEREAAIPDWVKAAQGEPENVPGAQPD